MSEATDVLVLGASARAAAFSALRAGLSPWCVDLFADADLCARCPCLRLAGPYPNGFRAAIDRAPNSPWLYTGGLENYPFLIGQLADLRPLWGNGPAELVKARDPVVLAGAARAVGVPAPLVLRGPSETSRTGRWLSKPLQGAAGIGILFDDGDEDHDQRPGCYLQQFIEGEPVAALFAAVGRSAHLLGLTRQLVGERWLGAPGPFRYCGSIGPRPMSDDLGQSLTRLGERLTERCGLRGLFGIDGILREDGFWPVELNPRYPASVEVLEYATGLRALSWHRRAFVGPGPLPDKPAGGASVVGKAILFAREDVAFSDGGPWREVLRNPPPVEEMADFADLPHPGSAVEEGQPVLTLFARAATVRDCALALQEKAGEVERWLYGRPVVG